MIIQDDTQSNQPVPEPGVGSAYSNGLNKTSKYLGQLILVLLLVLVFNIPSFLNGGLRYVVDFSFAVNMLLFLYSFFVLTPLEYGVSYAFLKAARDEKPDVKDLTIVLNNYLNILVVNVIVGVLVSFGFLLLIIPGIFLLCKFAFVRYLVTDKKMQAIDAIRESWEMTNGYTLDIFFMGLLAIPIAIAGLMLFLIGVVFSMMWIEAAFASMYYAIDMKKNGNTLIPETQPGHNTDSGNQGPFV